MQTHRQIIKRRTMYWQVSAMAIFAAAGAAAALPFVGNMFKSSRPVEVAVLQKAPPAAPKPPVNIAGALEAMGKVTPYQAPPPPPPQKIADTEPVEPPTTPPPPVPTLTWSYIGSIITPTHRAALVKIEGAQEILAVGTVKDDKKLVAVERDHIDVEVGTGDAKETKTVKLTERSQLAPTEGPKHPVTFRALPTFQPPGAPGSPQAMAAGISPMGQPGGRPPNMNPAQPMPATYDQARMALQAARDNSKRPPKEAPPIQPVEINDEKINALKFLSEPDLSNDERFKQFQSLGIHPGMSVEDAMARLKAAGLDGGAAKASYNALEQNAKKEQDK